MRIPVKNVHGVHQNKFVGQKTKPYAKNLCYYLSRAQIDLSIGVESRTQQHASEKIHPVANTCVAECTARSHRGDSPHRQLLLQSTRGPSNTSKDVITISDDSEPEDVITISDDSELEDVITISDDSESDDSDLESEFGDHTGLVNGDRKADRQDENKDCSSQRFSCVICSDVVPSKEGQQCRGSTNHFYCLDCLQNLAKYTISEGSATIRCKTGQGICSAPFLAEQFQFLGPRTGEPDCKALLEQIAIDEIRRDLEQVLKDDAKCPFCPWSEQYPDIEAAPIFHCRNHNCRLASCRRCRRPAHHGHECNKTKFVSPSDFKAEVSSIFYECLSAAVIRRCNKCKTPFTLREACNKIVCSKCENKQCYVCHKNLDCANRDAGYAHFAQHNEAGKCPLYTNTNLLHLENKRESLPLIAKRISRDYPDLVQLVREVYTKLSEELREEYRSLRLK